MAPTGKTQQQNRRRSRRVKARSNIILQCRKNSLGLGPNVASRVLDISENGVCLVVWEPLEVKSEVEITINGHGVKSAIRRIGTIRWQVKMYTGQFCVGIEFQKNIDYRDLQNLVAPQ